MRVIANIDRVRIEAPDYAAHKGDNNVFTVYRKTSAASRTFILVLSHAGDIKTFPATTSTSVIKWDASEYLRTIERGSTIQAAVYEGSTSAPVQFWECTFVVYDGLTIESRHRGSESVIVTLPDEKVELYLRGNCTIFNGNPPTIPNDEYDGRYECVRGIEHRDLPQLLINYNTEHQWGQLWDEHWSDRCFYTFVKPCTGKDSVIIEYINADGCIRYASGRVLRDAYSTGKVDYAVNDRVVRDAVRRHVTKIGESIAVGFENITPGQYLEDIMLCNEVRIYGTEIVAVPIDSSITRDGKTRDILINFNIR